MPARRDSVDASTEEIASRYDVIDRDVEGVVSRIGLIRKHVSRAFEETLARHGLNHGEYRLLLRLATRPDRTMSAGEISRALVLSTGATTNRLDRLEAAGLVRRLPDPRDRRAVRVELTDEGAATIDAAVTEQAAKERDVLGVLSERDLARLNALLRQVLVSLEDADAAPAAPAGPAVTE
jgi:DNA-binding MarR family transcriptional regulator